MSQIEDRLRTALLDTPHPAPSIEDPLADLDRRVGRARSRRTTAGIAAIVVVVAAIVVPLSLAGRDHSAPQPTHPITPSPTMWDDYGVQSMTISADGSVWTLSTNQFNNPTAYIERHEPAQGQVVAKYAVPGWAEWITSAAGQIWVWGGGDGGYPHGYLEAIDPANGHHVITDLGFGKAILPDLYAGHPVLGDDGMLLGIREDNKVVDGYRLVDGRIQVNPEVTDIRGATQLVEARGYVGIADDSRVLTWINAGSLRRHEPPVYPPQMSGLPLAPEVPLVAAGPQGYWVASGDQLHAESDTDRPLITSPRSFGSARVPVMAIADGTGLYVGWAGHPAAHSARVLAYYSTAALRSADPMPTAVVNNANAFDLHGDIVGGVVYVSGDPDSFGTVATWQPAVSSKPTVTKKPSPHWFSPPPTPTQVAAQTWKQPGTLWVASGAGRVFDLIPQTSRGLMVEQRDPATGALITTYGGGNPSTAMSYGLNHIWAWNDDSKKAAGAGFKLTVYDQTPGGQGQLVHLPAGITDDALIFAGGYAWAADTPAGVLRLAVGSDDTVLATKSTEHALDDALQIEAEQLAQHRGATPSSQSGQLLRNAVALTDNGYLTWQGTKLEVLNDQGEAVQQLTIPYGFEVQGDNVANKAVVDAAGGVYVGSEGGDGGPDELAYYSPTQMRKARPSASAVLKGVGINSLAVDPSGGMIAQTATESLIHWDPAAAVR